MTFEEKCAKFEKNTENEKDIYKKVYRTVFLEKKKQEQSELENSLFTIMLQKEEKERRTNKYK